jgi:hypothetical protein
MRPLFMWRIRTGFRTKNGKGDIVRGPIGVGLERGENKQNLTRWHGLTSARSGRPTAYAFWPFAALLPVGRRSSWAFGFTS